MHNRFDQLVKRLARKGLSAGGHDERKVLCPVAPQSAMTMMLISGWYRVRATRGSGMEPKCSMICSMTAGGLDLPFILKH